MWRQPPSSTLPNLVLGRYVLLKYLEFMFGHLQGVQQMVAFFLLDYLEDALIM